MEIFYLHAIVFLHLQNSVLGASCGERRNVSGIEGGDVTLPVDQTDIRDISWVTDMRPIATTEPGKPVAVRGKFHKGRLDVTADGSLIITNLSREDQGIYSANILRQTSEQCTQLYDLMVCDGPPSSASTVQSNHNASFSFAERTLTFMAVVVSITLLLVIIVVVLFFKYHQKPSPSPTISPSQNDLTAGVNCEDTGWKENVVYSYLDIKQKDDSREDTVWKENVVYS
ncbi:uncharacterized protein LOC142108751 [Mixophyes fleayi]|uniref:uncharacterized protein LOC142108751 n=1 Tax=Mixophyes fleayi TaxID=3061075 RepID=UPI003F4D87EA